MSKPHGRPFAVASVQAASEAASGSDAWGERAPSAAGDAEDPLDTPEAQRYDDGLELGRGGMGRVVVSFDRRLGRQVARKSLRPDQISKNGAERLVAEARLAANLDHPGIVAVHDAGRDASGQPWYAMRLVRGQTLSRLAAAATSDEERLRLVPQLLAGCHAVAHAHERGIVHRDLKPDNLLAGPHGETQVADWGLAAQISDAAAGGAVGTRGYMAPEIADGAAFTPAADVYSLGASIAFVLTGAPPHDAADPGLRQLPAELRAIVERCLAQRPTDRYPNAGALADDLSAWLDGRLVQAHRYSTADVALRLYRLWRWPLLVAAVALLVVLIVALGGWRATANERDRAQRAERDARKAQQTAESASKRATESLGSAFASSAERVDWIGARPEAEVLAAAALAQMESAAARGLLARQVGGPEARLVKQTPLPPCSALRLSERGRFVLCVQPDAALVLDATAALVRRIPGVWVDGAVDEVSGRVLLTQLAYTARVFELPSGAPVEGSWPVVSTYRAWLARGGRELYSFNGGHWQHLALDDGDQLARQHRLCGGNNQLAAASFDHALGRSVYACMDGTLTQVSADDTSLALPAAVDPSGEITVTALTTLASGEPIVGTQAGGIWLRGRDLLATAGLAATRRPLQWLERGPAGQLVALFDGAGPLVWSHHDGPPRRLPQSSAAAVVFVDAETLLVAGRDLQTWHIGPEGGFGRVDWPSGFAAVTASADGQWIAAGGGEGRLGIWSLATGRELAARTLGARTIKTLAFDPSGQRLAVGAMGPDGLYWLDTANWEPRPGPPVGDVRRLGYLASGRLWLLNYGNELFTLDPSDQLVAQNDPVATPIAAVDAGASPDGRWLAVVDQTGGVVVVEDDPGLTRRTLQPLAGASVVAAGRENTLALATQQAVALADAQSGRIAWQVQTGGQRVEDLLFEPTGTWLMAADRDGEVRVYSVQTGLETARLAGHQQRAVALHVVGRDALLTAGWDGVVQRWNLAALGEPGVELLRRAETRWGIDATSAVRLQLK